MYANSVLPPFDGTLWACSREYFAGTTLNELSECQRRLPMANSRRRSSRANTLLFWSRFDTSANVVGSRYSAGARHLHPAPVGQRSGQLLGVLVVEDVALGAAHHQRGARHAGDRRPQELAPPLDGRRIDAAAVALVVLPHPLAVGHAPEIVEQAAPEQRGVAPRVERERAVH